MKTWQRILRRIVPPARRPVGWYSAIPLVVFAALFAIIGLSIIPAVFRGLTSFARRGSEPGALAGFLDWTRPVWGAVPDLEYGRPWAFILVVVTPWIWWMQAAGHSGLPAIRGGFASFCRLMICGLLILVLAEPRTVRTSDVVSVVYTVDVSDSVNEARNQAMETVAATAEQKPVTDQAGLVVFGRTAAVEYPPRESFPFQKFINSRVSQDATNLEQSLALSAAMLPEENNGRIVLISDGTETIGQLKDVVDDLQSRNVEVNVIPIEYDYQHEVLLERLDLPRFVRLGETYEASVVLTSLANGKGTLVLAQGEEVLDRREVEFGPGKSRHTFPIKVETPGYYEYEARIEVPAAFDNRSENNVVRNYLFIDGPGRILLVTDPQGNPQEWSSMQKALQQGERQVEVCNAMEFPVDPLSLMPYDAVVFADVAADSLTNIQMQSLHDAIRNLGVGFLMVGGPNSFGPGGYQGSVIEDALPISMEISNKKILPKGALAIILHTCEFPAGNSWAKRITKRAIQVLNAEDLVGALAYGMSGEEWIFEMTKASEYGELSRKINAASIGDMPDFAATMQMGLKGLVDSDAASRHMIIISDGDASPPSDKLIKQFIDNQVTVSTVAVFPHNGDTRTLEMIAGVTGGRFYYPSDPNQLPSIFVKEAKTLRRSQIQKRTFVPELENVDPMVRDIGVPPELHGYVLTSPKDDPRATVILSAPSSDKDAAITDGESDPILAVWRYGLGVTAAFTSDMTTRWGDDWLKWDQFQQMVNQMITRVGRVKREQFLRVYTYVNGNEGVVVVEDFHPEESLLDVTVSVTGPNNFDTTQSVRQIAPRRYQTSMELKGEGRYQVQISAVGTDRKETAYAGFIVSYSPEYLRFRANPIVLREIAERTGGEELVVDENVEELANRIFGERKPKRSSRPVFDWFLMALACMVPLDVAIRRVQIDIMWIARLFRRSRKESTATLGQLLQKTGEVRSSLAGRKDEGSRPRPAQPERPMMPRPSMPRPTAAQKLSEANTGTGSQPKPDQNSSAPAGDDGSTTSRLLAMKKKRDQEGK
ncbi:MAG: VWA domain-containing protein [Planctomycetaceae bacterium]|nr:VWA domain-containing protein [Planctomycetaceae bacterium]